ncbi:TIGR01777 family oxidoreductase [Corynebacterium mastitidis]|uniref:TIGR01777 family oxidoreductase n=1 Tax=Corynebacterium mastitidis TaxID=161890 RepID=A0ABU8P1P4_9CORY
MESSKNNLPVVAITGSSGLVGSKLTRYLRWQGHTVIPLVRKDPSGQSRLWNPEDPDPSILRGVDTLIHLAGEPIFGRFSAEHKEAIRQSRVGPTRRLAEVAARTESVTTMVCASAVGFYGYARDGLVDEESGRGGGFLADVCAEWEDACQPARDGGVRVVNVRTGLVLDRSGGLLKILGTLTRLGVNGPLAGGGQWFPWVGGDDLVRIYAEAVRNEDLRGPVNAVGPEKITNKDFTKALGRVLHRPTVLPVPRLAPALLLGEQGARELALASQRVDHRALRRCGFVFQHDTIRAALAHELG